VKSFVKSIISAAALAAFAAIPLAASAMTIGVSDEVDTTVLSGHVCQSSSSQSWTNGTTASNSTASKVGTEQDNGQSAGTVVDPGQTAGTITGQYNVSENTTSSTNGTYGSFNQSTSSLTGGQEVQTAVVNTVSTFANP
jgi:hypothetical protein